MTQVHSGGTCSICGERVAFEDGMRQTICECDPWCESCGRQYIGRALLEEASLCPECAEEEMNGWFSRAFLDCLSCSQRSALMREVRRWHA